MKEARRQRQWRGRPASRSVVSGAYDRRLLEHVPDRQPIEVRVAREDVPEFARLVAELLEAQRRRQEPLVGVREVAAWLGVSRATVYRHVRELGGIRIGDGPRARLRFRLSELDERLPRGWMDWAS